jgi:predicted nucleic acid-binding protein
VGLAGRRTARLVIVVATSAWVETLRATASPVDNALSGLLAAGADLAVTEVVVLELLAGAGSERRRRLIRDRLLAFPVLGLDGLRGYEGAADLWRTCRSAGESGVGLAHCLVALPAIAAGAPVLHHDPAFTALAATTALAEYEV